jgi:hypothetical protein
MKVEICTKYLDIIVFSFSVLRVKSKSQSHITTDSQSVSQSVSLGVEPHLRLVTRYLFLFDSCDLFSVGRPL